MRPRILLRTHYQVDEPRIIIELVTHCAGATVSRHDEAVAQCLKTTIRSWGLAFGLPAASYALDNARALGFVNPSNRWTSAGLTLAYLQRCRLDNPAMEVLDLTAAEKRLYLLQYLVGAGALALRFAAWMLVREETSDEQLGRDGIVEQLLVETLDDYLSLTNDARTRTAIRRERDRLRRVSYNASTRRHKRRPIIGTLCRLDLLEVSNDLQSIRVDHAGRLARLFRLVPTTAALERLATSRDNLREVVSQVYVEHVSTALPIPDAPHVAAAYSFAMGRGLQACPLEYLDDVLFALGGPVTREKPGASSAETTLEELHRRQPRDVRFHVDRRGHRAFVVLSDDAVQALELRANPAPRLPTGNSWT